MGVALLLAACTGGGDPGPTTPTGIGAVSARPTPTPTQTPAPETVHPERPDASGPLTADGAEAFARYFLELYGYVYSTGDVDEWERISHPDCVFCAAVAEQVAQNGEEGRSAHGGQVEVNELTSEQLTDDYVSVRATATQSSATLTDHSGEIVSETDASTLTLAIGIMQVDDSWLVQGLESIDEDSA